ncbi:hypothetical protein B0H13DRAFT_1856008 [Mycena leptocephala]|nr:hypothetical protein B0H13DRAFT_1856008 [Mycena leptocephala]
MHPPTFHRVGGSNHGGVVVKPPAKSTEKTTSFQPFKTHLFIATPSGQSGPQPQTFVRFVRSGIQSDNTDSIMEPAFGTASISQVRSSQFVVRSSQFTGQGLGASRMPLQSRAYAYGREGEGGRGQKEVKPDDRKSSGAGTHNL